MAQGKHNCQGQTKWTKEQLKKKNRKEGKGVDSVAKACQSVGSTWLPSTAVSSAHTLPVKTVRLFETHVRQLQSNSSRGRHNVDLT